MPRLFSYGTLRDPEVQRATVGRVVGGVEDALLGCERVLIEVTNPAFVAATGTATHADLRFTGTPDSRVPGVVLELTDDELARCDRYEAPANYRRRLAPLASGGEAWVYVHAD